MILVSYRLNLSHIGHLSIPLHLVTLNGKVGTYTTCLIPDFLFSYISCVISAIRSLVVPYLADNTVDIMSIWPSSPSAHFYANRGDPFANQQIIPGVDESPIHVELFGHFQGFPPHGTDQQPMYQHGLHDYQVSEEMISPRMPIPNPALLREVPLPRAHGLARNNKDMRSRRHYHTSDQHNTAAITASNVGLYAPVTGRWSSTHQHSLPPLPTSTYLHGPTTDVPFSRRFYFASTHQESPEFPSAQLSNNTAGTIRVSSVSELSSASTYDDHAIRPGDHNHNNGCGYFQGIDHSALSQRDNGAPAVYPGSGISSGASLDGGNNSPAPTVSTDSFVSMVGKDLADDVVEVHDVCLIATQRYLAALRINWRLRHGRRKAIVNRGDVSEQHAASVGILERRRRGSSNIHHREVPKRKSASARRWRPRERGNRQALDENGDLKGSGSCLGNLDEGTGDLSSSPHCPRRGCPRDSQRRGSNRPSPIPRPTDSLLENIHHICELIWQRARRDRADVLGAEAKGCRDMRDLQDCGETIVLYNSVDFERDPDECFGRVLEAGRGICRQLRDWEALRTMEEWDADEEGTSRVAAPVF